MIVEIPSPERPVLVIGAAGIDIVGRLRSELHMGTSNPAQIRASHGGVARNVAENLARLGHPVRLLTMLGEDQLGDQLLQQTAEAGVDVSAVRRSSEFATGAYLAVVNSHGALQHALDDMRAVASISPQDLRDQETLFKEASIIFVDANLSKDTLRTAISLARRAKVPVCADPASAVIADRLKPYLNRLFMINPNSAEASILTDLPLHVAKRREALQAAKYLVAQGVGIAIVALAEFGVCYATSQTSGYIPAIRTPIVDPTGGGDALTATVIFALLNDIPLDDAVRLGVSAASLTLGHAGAVFEGLSLEKLYDQLII